MVRLVIRSKITNTTNKIWAKFAGLVSVSLIGVAYCFVQDTKGKKEVYVATKASNRQRVVPAEARQKIIKLFENAPAFSKLNGFEISDKLTYNFWASLGRFSCLNQSAIFRSILAHDNKNLFHNNTADFII